MTNHSRVTWLYGNLVVLVHINLIVRASSELFDAKLSHTPGKLIAAEAFKQLLPSQQAKLVLHIGLYFSLELSSLLFKH